MDSQWIEQSQKKTYLKLRCTNSIILNALNQKSVALYEKKKYKYSLQLQILSPIKDRH